MRLDGEVDSKSLAGGCQRDASEEDHESSGELRLARRAHRRRVGEDHREAEPDHAGAGYGHFEYEDSHQHPVDDFHTRSCV